MVLEYVLNNNARDTETAAAAAGIRADDEGLRTLVTVRGAEATPCFIVRAVASRVDLAASRKCTDRWESSLVESGGGHRCFCDSRC